jgi:hypothetical protein
MKKLSKEEANKVMDAVQKIATNEKEVVTVNISIVLEGSQARFYRIMHELKEVLGIPEDQLDPIIFNDGISEAFKKIWAIFSLNAMQHMMVEDLKEKNQKEN